MCQIGSQVTLAATTASSGRERSIQSTFDSIDPDRTDAKGLQPILPIGCPAEDQSTEIGMDVMWLASTKMRIPFHLIAER